MQKSGIHFHMKCLLRAGIVLLGDSKPEYWKTYHSEQMRILCLHREKIFLNLDFWDHIFGIIPPECMAALEIQFAQKWSPDGKFPILLNIHSPMRTRYQEQLYLFCELSPFLANLLKIENCHQESFQS